MPFALTKALVNDVLRDFLSIFAHVVTMLIKINMSSKHTHTQKPLEAPRQLCFDCTLKC